MNLSDLYERPEQWIEERRDYYQHILNDSSITREELIRDNIILSETCILLKEKIRVLQGVIDEKDTRTKSVKSKASKRKTKSQSKKERKERNSYNRKTGSAKYIGGFKVFGIMIPRFSVELKKKGKDQETENMDILRKKNRAEDIKESEIIQKPKKRKIK